MEPLQILDRHYQSFIDETDHRLFFHGLFDYFQYAETLPPFDYITTKISVPGIARLKESQKLHLPAFDEVVQAHKEITKYIADNKINSAGILERLSDYDGIMEGRIRGSGAKVQNLYGELRTIMRLLHDNQEHRAFAAKYVEYDNISPDFPSEYLPLENYKKFANLEDLIASESKNALWGVQNELYELYHCILKGRDEYYKTLERMKNKEVGAALDMMDIGIFYGEWHTIENNTRPNQRPTFFNAEKVRPLMKRYHLQVLSRFVEAEKALTNKDEILVEENITVVVFDKTISKLHVHGTFLKVRRNSNQFKLLSIVMSDIRELGREWDLLDVGREIDGGAEDDAVLTDRYYQAGYQINKNLAIKGIIDFFLLTTDNLRINSRYLT
jgi:hypothetical protein